MILTIMDTIFYLLGDLGVFNFKAYSSMGEQQRKLGKFCTVMPTKTNRLARAAKSNGSAVWECETELLLSVYYPENISVEQIYSESEAIEKKLLNYYSLNTTSVIIKGISYDGHLKMRKRDFLNSIISIQEEQ